MIRFSSLLAGFALATLAISAHMVLASTRTDQLFGTRTTHGDNTRACVPKAGAATAIACTASASASSGALTADSRYLIQCEHDAYLVWGTSAATATSSGFIIPRRVAFDFATDDTVLYVACLNVDSDGACRYIECQ